MSDKFISDFVQLLSDAEKTVAEQNSDMSKVAEALGVSVEEVARLNPNLVVTAEDDAKLLREKQNPLPITDPVAEAHPEPVVVAEAPHQGGLVENLNEAHAKIVDMVHKMPTGFPMMGLAASVQEFVKMADKLDERGLHEQAAELESIAAEMISSFKGLKKKLKLANEPEQIDIFPPLGSIKEVKDVAKNVAKDAVETTGATANATAKGGRIAQALNKIKNLKGVELLLAAPKNPYVLGAIIAGIMAYQLAAGSLQESLSEDIEDMKNEINDLKTSRFFNLSTQGNALLSEMVPILNEIKSISNTILTSKDPATIVEGLVEIKSLAADLRFKYDRFKVAEKGIISSLTGGFFTSHNELDNRIQDVNANIDEFLEKMVAQLNEDLQKVVTDSHAGGTEPTKTKESDESPEIREMQQFLVQKGFMQGSASGIIDESTRAGVENYLQFVRKQLGYSSKLNEERILREGTRGVLSTILDDAKNIESIVYKKLYSE